MAGAWGIRRRPIPAPSAAAALLIACLVLAALTLFAPSSPSYDPFAWSVWGRELMPGAGGEPFGLAGGPSWKPLPVLFTTPFALTGDAAPALWLLVARAGLLLALAGAFTLGRRLGGLLAAAVAALALLLLADVVSLAWRGASEPLLLACVLWAGERHLAGARRTAFALGVAAALIRPEATPFVVAYAAWLWRGEDAHGRALLLGGLALVPVLWIGLPALAGDPFAASSTAHNPTTRTTAWSALCGDVGLALAVVWLLAALAVALRPRDRAVRTLALGAVAWLALLAAMAAAGYASPARYAMPAAACACVLAGVAVAALADRVRAAASAPAAAAGSAFDTRLHPRTSGRAPRTAAWTALALLAAIALALPAAARLARIDDQVREGAAVARSHDDLRAAIDAAGGAATLRRCALHGWLAVNHTAQSALAWELRAGLGHVALTMRHPGLLVRAPRSAATGAPPPVTLRRPLRVTQIAAAGAWRVLAVRSAGGALPPACKVRKASGPARRIPNI
jgi:MFS family permease